MDVLHACLVVLSISLPTANCTTQNFVVTAPTAEFAELVGQAAEHYRRELALEWLGREMPRWANRCPIFVKVGEYSASGATSFNFDQGEVYGWKMNVTGTAERILDSVLPHEVNHTIFASHFRRPLPRWADEGAASLIEHESERMRLKKIHEQVMRTTRKIPLQKLLPMREYPSDTQQVLTLYAEGYSLADFLIQQSSKPEYLRFLTRAHQSNWPTALKQSYGYSSIGDLEQDLDQWVLAGSPALNSPAGEMLALSNTRGRQPPPTIRAQSDDLPVRLGSPTDWPAPTPFREMPRSENLIRGGREHLESAVAMTPAPQDGRLPRTRLVRPVQVVTSLAP